MFKKLFGSSDKEKKAPTQAPKQPPKDDIEAKKIKIQAACNALDIKIQEFEDKERKYENKIEILKKKAKELLESDHKKQARKYVEEATRVQKQMESYTLRKKALVDKKFQLDQAIMDMDTIDAIDGAQVHMKDQEKYSQKLEDIILDGQEVKMQQQEINDKLKDLVGNESDDEDVDDMLNGLLNQIKSEKKKNIETGKNVNANVPAGKQMNKAKKEEDDIAKMLADLG